MANINVPTKDQVDAKANIILTTIEKQLGMLPNIYATIGYSSSILEGYLSYSNVVGATSFDKKQGEAIKLAVSETNGCEYCTAAHTALAKMNGFSEAETIQIRTAEIADETLNVLVSTAQEIASEKGRLSQESRERFFNAGFDAKTLIDLIAVVNLVSFTNFVHNATKVPVDFPAAPSIVRKTV